jgi:putative ubiquitin-RnfH superfamily antitoxin RatB of RatAB toxin-antitoxin module
MANVDAGAPTIEVELAYSPAPREMRTAALRLPAGSTVADALRASGWEDLVRAAAGGGPLATAVWGQARALSAALREGDRVEVLRPLTVAPMEARRARYEAAGGVKALRKRRQAMQPVKPGRGD